MQRHCHGTWEWARASASSSCGTPGAMTKDGMGPAAQWGAGWKDVACEDLFFLFMWMVGIGWYWNILGIIWGHDHPFASGFVFFLRWTEGRQSFDILWHIVTLLVYPLVVEPPKIRCFMACGTLVYWIGCPSSHRHLKNCFYTNGNRKWRNNCRLANIQPIEILIGFHFLSVFVVSGELIIVNPRRWCDGDEVGRCSSSWTTLHSR